MFFEGLQAAAGLVWLARGMEGAHSSLKAAFEVDDNVFSLVVSIGCLLKTNNFRLRVSRRL
jgi:hypothetical protein